jgi:fused signal recognition particle receptor
LSVKKEKKSKKTEKKKEKVSRKSEKKESKSTKARRKEEEEVEEIIKEAEQEPIIEKEEEKPEEKQEEEKGIASVKEEGWFTKLFKKAISTKLNQEQFDEIFSELEITLLENNVALEVVDKIKESLSKELLGTVIRRNEAGEKILDALKKAILSILIPSPDLLKQIKEKEGIYTILFFGINGSGKTTSIAKVAYKLKQSGISCVLAAADTFRAASIEQLQKHGENLGVPVIAQTYGADPAAVAFDAIQYAKKHNIKVVLIDTAGRMYTKVNLLKEMAKIIHVANPDLKIFVGESITGNDATEQAKTFNESAGIDGIILSKADVDEKAGTILSVGYVTQKPIYYLGMGQEYKDLKEFSPKDVLRHLGLED